MFYLLVLNKNQQLDEPILPKTGILKLPYV